MFRSRASAGFTLIELLVVIAILAILATVIVVVINPVELLKQSRDTNRLADLASINKALGLLLVDSPSVPLGTVATIYVSIPDTSPTCANLGLPPLPSGYTYGCVTSSTLRKIDGTGWIPVNLRTFSSGAALANLPVDSVNTTSSGLYYTYVTGGTDWELSSLIESNKYAGKTRTDGGRDILSYEIGSNLSLAPFAHGLVGYWPFDESAGLTGLNSIPQGSNVTWSSEAVHAPGKIGYGATFTNGGPAYGTVTSFPGSGFRDFTAELWMRSSTSTYSGIGLLVGWHGYGGWSNTFRILKGLYNDLALAILDAAPVYGPVLKNNTTLIDGAWHHVAMVRAGTVMYFYRDGVLDNTTTTGAMGLNTFGPTAIGIGGRASGEITADLDELRIYSRALSATEVSNIYNATK